MSQTEISTETLYQLALAIGNRFNLEEMLNESLGAYLQCLQAVSGEIYFVERSQTGLFGFKRAYGFQRLNGDLQVADGAGLEGLPVEESEAEIHEFLDKLPRIVLQERDNYIHLLELPGLGLLTLTTLDAPLHKQTVVSLIAINRKLADACLLCLSYRQLKQTNKRLAKKNEHLCQRSHLLNAAREELSTIIQNAQFATSAIHKWERKLQKIMGNACDVSFSLDAECKLSKISRKISMFTDFTADELIGQSVKPLFFDESERIELAKLLRKDGKVKAFEAHFINKDGYLLYVCMGVYAIYDATGKVAGYDGVLTDFREWEVSADSINVNTAALESMYRRKKTSPRQIEAEMAHRREAEQAAQRAASLNAEIVSMISQMLINVDANDRICHWNSATERITGIPAESVVGKPFLSCGIKWDWDKMVKMISVCTEEERQVRLKHFCYTRPDTSNGWLDLTIRPFIDKARQHAGIIIVGQELPEEPVE